MIKELLATIVIRELIHVAVGMSERRQIFTQAREYADNIGKPLLVVGTPKLGHMYHPCGDTTIDIDPSKAKYCNTEIADVRDIPYPNQYFGAAFVSHVLEHLPTIADACQALDELERVAERVFTVSPRKTSLIGWLNPQHHLWVTPSGDGYVMEQRGSGKARTGYYTIMMAVIQGKLLTNQH